MQVCHIGSIRLASHLCCVAPVKSALDFVQQVRVLRRGAELDVEHRMRQRLRHQLANQLWPAVRVVAREINAKAIAIAYDGVACPLRILV